MQRIEKTIQGAILGGVVGTVVGAAIGYGIGYIAGGTCASGLAMKSIYSAVKAFMSQKNKIHHALCKPSHNLTNYTIKEMKNLMKEQCH